jgi:hypothetical protein
MLTLERMIKKMTIATPTGGYFNIGKASITVAYCSDCWEWEYLGETYWDVLDLAEAIAHGSPVVPRRRSLFSKSLKIQKRPVRSNRRVFFSFLEIRRLILDALFVRRTKEAGPMPALAICSEG